MNTIEFAVKDGVPYAIDFLNPAPDFERDRITEFYFEHVVDRMARLVIDRALNGSPANSWPRWEEMLGIGAAAGLPARLRKDVRERKRRERHSPSGAALPAQLWHGLLRPRSRVCSGILRRAKRAHARGKTDVRRPRALPVPPSLLSLPPTMKTVCARSPSYRAVGRTRGAASAR